MKNNRDRRDRNSRGSGGRSFNDRDFGQSHFSPRPPRTMNKAICAKCGKECEVPFKPTEGRPVFCRECFSAR